MQRRISYILRKCYIRGLQKNLNDILQSRTVRRILKSSKVKIGSVRTDSIFFVEFILQFAQIHRNIMTVHFLVEMRVFATFAIDFPYAGMLRSEMENERESM